MLLMLVSLGVAFKGIFVWFVGEKYVRLDLTEKLSSFIYRPRLKNVDRSSAQHMAVTVGNITVIITDYKLLKPENSPSVTPDRNSPGPLSEDNADPGPSLGSECTSNGVNNQEDSS